MECCFSTVELILPYLLLPPVLLPLPLCPPPIVPCPLALCSSTNYNRRSRWVLLDAAGSAVTVGHAVAHLTGKLISHCHARQCWGP
jgi:hypothetical protein